MIILILNKINKNLILHLFLLIIAFIIIPQQLHAQWAGNGSDASPYLISDADDLKALSTSTSDFSGKYFKQTDNIDLNGEPFTPIGIGTWRPFKGNFNGAGYTISNLTITTATSQWGYIGLFAYIIEGHLDSIKLLNVNVNVSYKQLIGGIVGGSDYSTITNCYVEGNVVGGEEEGVLWEKQKILLF